jgi:hypothetical protein
MRRFSFFKEKEVAQPITNEIPLQDTSSNSTGHTAPTTQDDAEKDAPLSPRPSKREGEMHDPDKVNYVNMNWYHCGLLMIAECISLGVLSLPHAMAVLGLVR